MTLALRASDAESALLTVAAISLLLPLVKVRTSCPWRNSVHGWIGELDKAARTEASMPAWRKRGTGWRAAAPPRVMMIVLP